MSRKTVKQLALVLGLLILASCSVLGTPGTGGLVPTTGDTASDPSAVQRFLPNIPGYNVTDADSLVDAITAVTGGASLLTGNPVTAAMVAQIDGMIQCYQNVGAVGARIYTQANIGQLLEGQVPAVGALAMINQDRLVNNFLPCALGSAGDSFRAQGAAVEPCSGSGSFVAEGETIHYLYAATQPDLCAQFQAHIPS